MFLRLVLVFCFLSHFSASAKNNICPVKDDQECAKFLRNYPLFDTDYKIAANYVPVLPLRALAHAEVYREKKSFHLERYYYVKNLKGELGKAYQSVILDGEITGFGIFNRKIIASGKLNDFNLEYENKMSFSLPKRAHMKVHATLDGLEFLKLEVNSDGDAMTNDVDGDFFGKKVHYHTEWRDTEGMLAGLHYNLHAEGVVKENTEFKTVSKGSIGEYPIQGEISMTSDKMYQSSEDYGPITVKSILRIID